MALTATVQRRRGATGLKRLQRNLSNINGEDVEVGYFNGEQHSEADLSYASLALILEKGTRDGTIPARFLFETIAILNAPNTSLQARNIITRGIASLGRRNSAAATLDSLGRLYQQLLQDAMGMSPPLISNAPSVVERKGRNSPYEDTGELQENLGYRTSKSTGVKK